MKFIGGPMHGKDVPDELPRYRITFANGTIVEAVQVLMLDSVVRSYGADELHAIQHVYLKTSYWVGLGKPLMWCFMKCGEDEDTLIELARQVLSPC